MARVQWHLKNRRTGQTEGAKMPVCKGVWVERCGAIVLI